MSAQCKQLGSCALPIVNDTRVRHIFSHSHVAYIRVFWEVEEDTCRSFNQLPRTYRRYNLGDEQAVDPSVSKALFIKVYI